MVRKLALAVSLALGTWNLPVYALGLGELSSKSTLNQNFQGEITLLSVAPEELDSVRVKLADADAFARIGVERPYFLSLLKFEPTLAGKGNPVIRVTSEFPIREPFLNFLIEVNWPKGRLLREYTVLLDPPTTTRQRPPAVAPAEKASRAAAPAAVRETAAAPAPPQPAAASAISEYGPVRANDTAWSIAKKVRPRGVSMEQMMIALLNANPQAFVDDNINRLRRGQILRIPQLQEIQQVGRREAHEAYRRQQDDWLAKRDAKLQQAAEAASGDAMPAEGAPTTAESSDQLRIATARPEGQGEAGAGDDDAQSPIASDLRSRLIVARENAETSRQAAETLRTQVDDLQSRLANMQKLLSLKDEQLAQLQDRVATVDAAVVPQPPAVEGKAGPGEMVEPPVEVTAGTEPVSVPPAEAVAAGPAEAAGGETRQTLLADYRIEDIPPQVDADKVVLSADAGGVVPAAAPGDAAVDTAESSPTPADDYQIGEIPAQIDADRVVLSAAAEGPASGAEVVEPVPAPAGTAPVAIEPAVSERVPEVERPVPPVTAAVAGDALVPAPLAGMLEQNIVPIAAGAVGLLAFVGWLTTRRRRDDEAGGLQLAGAGAAGLAATRVAAGPDTVGRPGVDAEMPAELADSSLLDDLSPSEINALQDETGEVDPVSEADVYIAYGRYQQAEELLRQAMDRDPNRLALKHKLLEVHYATRNPAAFTALAQEMVDAGQDTADEDAWTRARDMGRELAPADPLFETRPSEATFGLAAVAGGATTAAAMSQDADTLSLNEVELSELVAAYDEPPGASGDLEAPSEVSILLDLEQASELADQTDADLSMSIPLEDFESLDFEVPTAEKGGQAGADHDDERIGTALDLDRIMAEADATVDREDQLFSLDSEFSAADLQAELDQLSDLSVLDSSLDDPAERSNLNASGRLGLVSEDSGVAAGGVDEPLSLDRAFDVADEGDEIPELMGLDQPGYSGDGDGDDDVATKLDLARAYVDMGDEDGARSILEEVVVEGNDTQRGDARQLLARLG